MRCHLIKQNQGGWNGFKGKALATKRGHVSWGPPAPTCCFQLKTSCYLPFRSRHGLHAHKIINQQANRSLNKSGKQVGQSQGPFLGPCHMGEVLHVCGWLEKGPYPSPGGSPTRNLQMPGPWGGFGCQVLQQRIEYLFPSPIPNKWTFSLAPLGGPGNVKRQVGVGKSGASRKRQKGRLKTSHKDHRILVR